MGKVLTLQEFCEKYRVSKWWVYKRTGPRAKLGPRLPTVAAFGDLRFDEDEVDRLMSRTTYGSLKTDEVLKLVTSKQKRRHRL